MLKSLTHASASLGSRYYQPVDLQSYFERVLLDATNSSR